MNNELLALNERIESYLNINSVELTTEQRDGVLRGVQFWYQLAIDEAIGDAVTGVTYDDAITCE